MSETSTINRSVQSSAERIADQRFMNFQAEIGRQLGVATAYVEVQRVSPSVAAADAMRA